MKNLNLLPILFFAFQAHATDVKMDLAGLKAKAFALCQKKQYQAPKPIHVPLLDPPNGGLEAEGMSYQEELALRTRNLLDQQGFYFSPRPRAAVNSIPMDIYVDLTNTGNYQLKTWEDAEVDYSSNIIIPPIDKNLIPPEGRVLTELVIGHVSPKGDYPQLFDLRSSAYFRFAGYPPQITGASLRLGANNIAGLGENNKPGLTEDFPVVREIYASVKTNSSAKVLVLIESDLLCGALDMEMNEGEITNVVVDSYWFTRRDFEWKKSPNTAFIAYSSMLWKTEKQTPENNRDEAHDSDTVRVQMANGANRKISLQPTTGSEVVVRDLTSHLPSPVTSWSLANEDRTAEHYAEFQPYLGATNYPFRASYKVDVLESSIKTAVSLYMMEPDKEYKDNVVAAQVLRQDFKKAKSVRDAVHFKYRTTAY